MSRMENRVKAGYFAIEEKHHAAILSLVAPATPAHKLLDPFAGEGAFLDAAARQWNMTPYANELDADRAEACIARFGLKQAVHGDVERLSASSAAFSLGWYNPPYDHDKAAGDYKRVEFRFLRHAWKWIQPGGLVLWAIYQHHLTEQAMTFLAKHTARVDVWALPGKHLGEYDQVIVAAVPGRHPDSERHYADIADQKAHPLPLTAQDEPVYRLPAAPNKPRFLFAPNTVDERQGRRLIELDGAWRTSGFQALLAPPLPPAEIEPVVAPRPGHTALVLAAGVADGAVIATETYGTVAIRGKTETVETVDRVEVEADPKDPDRQIKKTVMRLKPATTLTLLSAEGTTVEMQGDEALLDFIRSNKTALAAHLNESFQPLYRFDLNGIGRFLDRVRVNGKYPLYTAQKHVVAAITRGFERRKGILLSGMMGTGKTSMGGTTAVALASGAVAALRESIGPEQVVLVVAPPHLVKKWKRELLSIDPTATVEQLDRHEDVKAFMAKAEMTSGVKVGLIKRDLTKLGCGWEPSVVWRKQPVAHWPKGEETPDGYAPEDRVTTQTVPQCPHCGATITRERKGHTVIASKVWLKAGRRTCTCCNRPLWSQKRDRGAQPKPGEKTAKKNPRWRIDDYIKRHYAGRIALLIWDEVHEGANGATGNGVAFGRLAGVADRVLGLTGTPFNGRASSLFNIEYHLNPRVRERFPWGGSDRLSRKDRSTDGGQIILFAEGNRRGHAESRWVEVMGVREQVVEERPSYDSETGAFTGTSTYERPYTEGPGLSPALVAEMLDHTIYFSLGDLGKALPRYEEIALPVALDDDVYAEYDRTRSTLKDYLVQRRWEGDTTFRGSYLQWAMGWPNAAFRPTEVIHNIKSPISGKKRPHTVVRVPSYGEDRVYAKEQALIDLIEAELAADRPCVVYLRQTGTRDIQPRIERIIREALPEARPFVLKNTVAAERREATVERARAEGANVLITNPELVKTGLDLLAFPTLVFFEITFNLSTMMQASARAYRLNQTHAHCKTVYMFAEDTMEHTAVQLMSRKQRAAKLLTGDMGLTGLEALTEGEGGFEAALMDAIASDETLIDPAQLFVTETERGDDDADDAAFWQVATATDAPEPVLTRPTDSLTTRVRRKIEGRGRLKPERTAATVARVVNALENGVWHPNDEVKLFEGVCHPDFARYPVHARKMAAWLTKYLRSRKVAADPEVLTALAGEIVASAALYHRVRVPEATDPKPKRRAPRLTVREGTPEQPTLFDFPYVHIG